MARLGVREEEWRGKGFSLERTSSDGLKGNRMEVRAIYKGSRKVKGLGWTLKTRVWKFRET